MEFEFRFSGKRNSLFGESTWLMFLLVELVLGFLFLLIKILFLFLLLLLVLEFDVGLVCRFKVYWDPEGNCFDKKM